MDTTPSNELPAGASRFSGHLYYVSLTTSLGLVYKLGFTKLELVRERQIDGAPKMEPCVDMRQYRGAINMLQSGTSAALAAAIFAFTEKMPCEKF